jgi:hypothetical protein
VLAYRWNRAVDNYSQNADRMILARYEEFVKDKVGFIAHLAGQLNVQEKRDISSKVDIQYQPPGDHRISWGEFFGTRNLGQIEQLCGGRMATLGYTPTLSATNSPGLA